MFRSMKKSDLARKLAAQQKTTHGAAADCLDHAVNQVLIKLKHGTSARLPGLGTICPDKDWSFTPEGDKK